jgi:hypothetical protein
MQIMGARFFVPYGFRLVFTTPDLPISYAIRPYNAYESHRVQYTVSCTPIPYPLNHVHLLASCMSSCSHHRARAETSTFQNLKASLQARVPQRSRFSPGRSLRIFTGPPDFCLSPWAKEPGVTGDGRWDRLANPSNGV